jgi:hypothetical protein
MDGWTQCGSGGVRAGVRIEQPFDVLPLWQYVDAIDASCKQILQHSPEP